MRRLNSLIARAAGYVHHRFANRALILMYHRVAELPGDPQMLSVVPEQFAEQLEIIRRYARPMSLQELVRALEIDKLPRRAVVVTFDDGYADNLFNAKPILERFSIPATVFVTAGQISSMQEFWWDELERLILQPDTLPMTLSLSLNGGRFLWSAGSSADTAKGGDRGDRGWNIEKADDPSPVHQLYRSLYFKLHAMPGGERRAILEELRAWAGLGETGRASHRTLSVDELVQLSEGGLVEIGAHTLTHPLLASLLPAAQRSEITRSKSQLEEILNRPVNSFAYPHGSYTEETVAIIRQAGFTCACSSDADAVWRGADPFRLPRVVVRDWGGEPFSRWIKAWFGI